MHQEPQGALPAFEATSLMNKFKSLWIDGVDAKVVFETHAGQAWGVLHVSLGEHPGQVQPPLHPQGRPHRKENPAKQRRRERRKAAQSEPAVTFETVDLVAEEATHTNSHHKNEDVNSATEEVATVDEDSPVQTAAEEEVNLLKETNEKLNNAIVVREDTIEELNDKLKKLSDENLELKQSVMVTQMFYDGFRDEMKEKFGYDSDEEAEKNWQEILKKDELERNKFSCDKCAFASKSEAGLKIHETKKHRGN